MKNDEALHVLVENLSISGQLHSANLICKTLDEFEKLEKQNQKQFEEIDKLNRIIDADPDCSWIGNAVNKIADTSKVNDDRYYAWIGTSDIEKILRDVYLEHIRSPK